MTDSVIEILCDGGPQGLGHLSRCSALGWRLAERGKRVRVRALSDIGLGLLPKSPLEAGTAGLVVIDLPYDIISHVSHARSCGIRTVALDYFGAAEPDLTISVLEHRNPLPPGKRVSGLRYAMIRKDIIGQRPAAIGLGALICIGGADLIGKGPEIASQLAGLGEKTTLVVGPYARPPAAAISGVEFLRAPSDLPSRMARCRWAVTNGGTTMMEMMCLGKPVHVVPQTADEERLAKHIALQGGLLGVGIDSLRVPTAADMASSASCAASLIDGQGIDRIARAIEGLL